MGKKSTKSALYSALLCFSQYCYLEHWLMEETDSWIKLIHNPVGTNINAATVWTNSKNVGSPNQVFITPILIQLL